jgi:hypothetical protein
VAGLLVLPFSLNAAFFSIPYSVSHALSSCGDLSVAASSPTADWGPKPAEGAQEMIVSNVDDEIARQLRVIALSHTWDRWWYRGWLTQSSSEGDWRSFPLGVGEKDLVEFRLVRVQPNSDFDHWMSLIESSLDDQRVVTSDGGLFNIFGMGFLDQEGLSRFPLPVCGTVIAAGIDYDAIGRNSTPLQTGTPVATSASGN